MSIQDTLNKVEKALSTPAYIQGAELVRENLDGFINDLTNKKTPVRDRLARVKGSGLAASWVVLTGIGGTDSAFAEGTTPAEDATVYGRRSAVYKELGKVKAITDLMEAAGESFFNAESSLTEVAMREVILDEEQLIILGDEGTNPLEFDGIDTQIVSKVINDANNALGFRTDLLDQAIELLVSEHNVTPTAIYIGYGMQRAINQSLAGNTKIELTQGNSVSTGIQIGSYQSMVGLIPFIATFAIAGDTTSYPGNTVETLYVVTEKTEGQNVLYMSDLYAMRKTPLARTGAAFKFMTGESTVLVNRAEEFHVKIENVRVA